MCSNLYSGRVSVRMQTLKSAPTVLNEGNQY